MLSIPGLPRLRRFCSHSIPRRRSSQVHAFFALVVCALLLSISWDVSPFPSVPWGLLEPCAGREHADCFHALYPRRLPILSRRQVSVEDEGDAVKAIFSPKLKQVIKPDGAAPNNFGGPLFNALWRRFLIQASQFFDQIGLTWRWRYSRDAHNLALSRHQCRKAFPGLFDELLRAKQQYEKYHTSLDDLEDIDIEEGRVRVAVFDGELHIVESNLTAEDSRVAAVATLQSIQQSIINEPQKDIPVIEFVLDVRGQVSDVTKPVWVLDRMEQDDKGWLTPFVGSLETSDPSLSRQETKRNETQGTFTFKPLGKIAAEIDGQELKSRRAETEETNNADDWGSFLLTSAPGPDMSAPDVCRHKVLIHPDSQTTFNRLDSLLCASVNVMQSPKWINLYHGLMYSKPMDDSRNSLPDFQNVMLVDDTGPHLESSTPDLLRNTEVAKSMVSNAVETFRHRYLTEAATACYWRELIHTYSEVSYSPKVYGEGDPRRGEPLKTFL
ncbi:hypothetical protein PG984_005695 [Apiospora sp. TS-2023a]